MTKIKNKGQARLFENPILEQLTKSSPYLMLSVTGSFVALSYYLHIRYGVEVSIGLGVGLFFLGVLGWTLFEYIMHRYVFHFVNESEWSKRFHYLAHGVHHEYPRDTERLFMPPIPAIVLSTIILGLHYLIMGSYGFLFFPGFIVGYVGYVSMHYAMHRFKPPKFLKELWAHHALHHYKYPEQAYGVSSRMWDYVFRTMPPKKEEKRADVPV